MRINDLYEFQRIIHSSVGCVWVQDEHGLEYDLKSESGMQAFMRLLSNPNNGLELYASEPNVTFRLIAFLRKQNKAA